LLWHDCPEVGSCGFVQEDGSAFCTQEEGVEE